MPEVIAEHDLVGRSPEGESVRVRVAISAPEPSVKMSPAWQCAVSVEPLWEGPFMIYGEGSLQALCLAARHAVQMLDTFIAQGGVLEHSDGTEFDTGPFGFKLLPRE
jgi:hypothetical protein